MTALGTSIRERRRGLDLTLVALADLAGLSQPFLSQVENGRAAPSIESLQRIATALGTTPQALFAGHDAPADEPVVVRAADTAVAVHSAGESMRRLLLPGDAPFHVVELVGLPRQFREHWRHDGFEAVYVVAGPVDAEIDGSVRVLASGDFVSFRADLAHRYRSRAGAAARLLLVETPRTVGDAAHGADHTAAAGGA